MTKTRSSGIIDNVRHCCSPGSASMAYFYFDFNEAAKVSYSKLLRSLIKSFSNQFPSVAPALVDLYKQKSERQEQPTNEELLVTLTTMLGSFDQAFIIIDALDECSQEQTCTIKLFGRLLHAGFRNFHLLVTSRDELAIAMDLGSLACHHVDLNTTVVDRDIELYLDSELTSDSKLGKWSTLIKSRLMERAGGM